MNRPNIAWALLAGVPLIFASSVAPSMAQVWEGNVSNDWFTDGNWDGGTTPDGTANVVIDTVTPNPTSVTNSGVNGTAQALDLTIGTGTTGQLTISNGGALSNQNSFIASTVGGSGSVVVTGTGSSWTQSANLQVGFRGNGDLTISDGASVQNARGFVGNQPDAVGTVVITGTGSSWSNGAGLVIGRNGTGTVTVTDGGSLEVPAGPMVAGVIELGTFAGSGTVNIGADGGSAAAAAGTVNAGSIDFGDGTGTLVFNHTDNSGTYDFGTTLTSGGTGTHVVNHLAGWTNYSGNGAGFTGTTNINGGTLAVNGSLGGDINVNSGGLLAGTGSLGGVQVASGGGTAPGNNSIGTMNVDDISFAAGSTFFVDLDAAGNSDQILSTGPVNIAGGTVAVTGSPGVITNYDIITGSSVTGTFDDLTGLPDTLLVSYVLSYTATSVSITGVQSTSFCSLANSPNQKALACDGLASLPASNPIVDALLALDSPSQVRDAYDALSGEIHSSVKGALLENGQHKVGAVNDRIHFNAENSDTQTSVAAFGSSSLDDGSNGAWITGYGSWSDTDSNSNTFQADNSLGGVVFGIDREYSETWRAGVLGGYSQSDVTQDELRSSGTVDTWSLGLYGGAEVGPSAVSFGAIYNWHDIDTSRTVKFPGVNQALSASYDAQSWQLFAEYGYEIQSGYGVFEPFAGISYINLDTDSYRETGGTAALSASSITNDTTFTTLGVRASTEIIDKIEARGMIGWRHAFGDRDAASSFTLSGSDPFTVTGAPIAEDAFVTELGFEAEISNDAFIGASYNGQFGDSTTAHGFNAGFRIKF